MAITTHVSAAPTGKAVGAKGVVSAVPEQELLVAASVVAKPSWQDDEHTVVFEDEGPLVSEAVGARFHYLAEAVDMTLDEAKAESQAEFQRQVQDSVLGVSVPFLSEVEKALLAIVERASGGTVVSGQDMEMTRQRVLFLEKDVRDIANGAIVLIRANTVSRPLQRRRRAEVTVKAYAVLEKYEMTGEIYFASKAIYAAVAGANAYADGRLGGVQCRRAPWADTFAESGVPAKLAVDHGWRFECSGCGVTVDADIECSHGLPMDGICGNVSTAVYCSARCKWKYKKADRRQAAEEALAIEDFRRIVQSRFPDADFVDDETRFRMHHASVFRAKGTGFWHRRQVVVSFRFPGMEYGPACFRMDGYDRIGPPNARYAMSAGDREAFAAYERAAIENRKRMMS